MDEQSYRRLVENSLGLMCIHDLDGVLTYVNPAAAQALGWQSDDGVGRSLRDYLAPSVEPLFAGYLERIRRKGHDSGLMMLEAKDGTERIWQYRNAVVAEPGEVPYVVGHAVDVTERVHAEQALRQAQGELEESHARHLSLVEGSALGVCIHQDGVIRFANRRLAEMHGWAGPEDLVGAPFTVLAAPGEHARIDAQAAAVLAGAERPDHIEVEHATRDGHTLWVETWSSAVQWQQRPAVLLTVVDISERKRLQAAVRSLERLESVGRLAGGVAHEINNLMTVVIGHGAFLSESLAGDEARALHVEPMVRSAQQAAGLAWALLAFGRRLWLRLERLDLGEVTTELSARIRQAVPATISCTITIDPALWPVRADRAQIGAALFHLVANARDAMPGGGCLSLKVANIELDAASVEPWPDVRPGRYVLTAVQDTGRGMAPEALAHLFEPFFTTKVLGKARGLGLPSVYGIVKQHGGHVEVESAPGQGTVVRLYLPCDDRPASLVPDGTVVGGGRAGAAPPGF